MAGGGARTIAREGAAEEGHREEERA